METKDIAQKIAAAYTFRSENSSVLFSRDCITAWLLFLKSL